MEKIIMRMILVNAWQHMIRYKIVKACELESQEFHMSSRDFVSMKLKMIHLNKNLIFISFFIEHAWTAPIQTLCQLNKVPKWRKGIQVVVKDPQKER